ncbi:MAG: hypothetical protein CMQ24_02235 [Gammaproteobacteria bacterium]|nr:hypothetical protein [Gammaproteobacteria bacterium]
MFGTGAHTPPRHLCIVTHCGSPIQRRQHQSGVEQNERISACGNGGVVAGIVEVAYQRAAGRQMPTMGSNSAGEPGIQPPPKKNPRCPGVAR